MHSLSVYSSFYRFYINKTLALPPTPMAPTDLETRKTPEGKSFLVKRCSRCKHWKRVFPLGADGRKVRKPNGATKMAFGKDPRSSTGLKSWCTDCNLQEQKERMETKEGKAKQMYQSAKNNNPERMLLTQEEWVTLFMRLWDEQDGRCSKTGWAFTLTQGAEKTQSNPLIPSFDRIDSSGKYEPGNIQLVCCWYNLAKNDHSEELMQQMCAAVAANNPLNILADAVMSMS